MLALKNHRDPYYARPIIRTYADGSVEVRLPGGNGAYYEAGTFLLYEAGRYECPACGEDGDRAFLINHHHHKK